LKNKRKRKKKVREKRRRVGTEERKTEDGRGEAKRKKMCKIFEK